MSDDGSGWVDHSDELRSPVRSTQARSHLVAPPIWDARDVEKANTKRKRKK